MLIKSLNFNTNIDEHCIFLIVTIVFNFDLFFPFPDSSLCSVLVFEDKANGAACKPDGPPPKRDISSLP